MPTNQLSNLNDQNRPEVSNARYFYLESEVCHLNHLAMWLAQLDTTNENLLDYSNLVKNIHSILKFIPVYSGTWITQNLEGELKTSSYPNFELQKSHNKWGWIKKNTRPTAALYNI